MLSRPQEHNRFMALHRDHRLSTYLAKQKDGVTILVCAACAADHHPPFTCKKVNDEKAKALAIGCQCRHESHHA